MKLENLKKLKEYNSIYFIDNFDEIKNFNDENCYVIFNKHNYKNEELLNKKNKKNKKNIKFFSWQYFKRDYLTTLADYKAYKNLDSYYHTYLERDKIQINFFKKLYKSNDIEIAIKKNLIKELKNYYEINIIIRILSFFSKKKVISLVDNHITQKNYIKKKNSSFNLYLLKKFLIFCFYPIFFSLTNKITVNKKKKFFKNCFRIYKNGVSVGEIGNLDWIVKDRDKNETLFVLEDYCPKDHVHVKSLEDKNYNYVHCNTKKQNGKILISEFFYYLIILFPKGLFIGAYIFFFNKDLKDFYYRAWLSFFRWNNFVNSIINE